MHKIEPPPSHLVQVVPGMCRVLEVVRVGAILSGERVTLLRADEAILCRISIFELRSRQDWEEERQAKVARACTKPGDLVGHLSTHLQLTKFQPCLNAILADACFHAPPHD